MNQISILAHAEKASPWPPHILLVRVGGDAMEPHCKEGDFVAVDTSLRDIQEGVYVLHSIANGIFIRRLHKPSRDIVPLTCDNEYYDDEFCHVPCVEKGLVGRVVSVLPVRREQNEIS